MRMIKNELYKLLSRKVLIILAVFLLAVDVAVMLFYSNSDAGYGVPDSAWRSIQEELRELSPKEQIEFIEEKLYAENVYSALGALEILGAETETTLPILEEQRAQPYIKLYANSERSRYTERNDEYFLSMILKELQGVYGYNDYLESIQKQADQMSAAAIFRDRNSFARRSINASAEVYSKMPRRELPFSVTFGIEAATSNTTADVCALIMSTFAALSLIIGEKENGAFSLLRTLKKGRAPLMVCKIFSLFIFCAFSAVLFQGVCLIISGMRFGFVDLGIPIQAVSGFIGCTIQCSLGTYLALFVAAKAISYFIIAMLIFTVSAAAKDNISIYLISGGIISAQLIMFLSIDGLSIISPLKYFNIVALTQTNKIFGSFRTVNFLNYPLDLAASSVILALFLAAGFIISAILICIKSKNDVYFVYKPTMLINRINPFSGKISVSLFRHECSKLLVTEKGAAALLAMLAVGYMIYTGFYIGTDDDDMYFRKYALEHGGLVSTQTDEFVEQESLKFEILEQRLAADSGDIAAELALRARGGFEIFRERYEYAKTNSKAEIVYDTGYALLLSRKNTFFQLMILFVFMSVIFAPVFTSDSRVMPLIRSTRNGRQRDIFIRAVICTMLTVVMFAIAHAPILIKISEKLKLDGIGVTACSILILRSVEGISVVGYLIVHYSALLALCILVMVGMLWVSQKMRSVNSCAILLAATTAVPCAVMWLI